MADEAKQELIRLTEGKRLINLAYVQDCYGRTAADIYVNELFIQVYLT